MALAPGEVRSSQRVSVGDAGWRVRGEKREGEVGRNCHSLLPRREECRAKRGYAPGSGAVEPCCCREGQWPRGADPPTQYPQRACARLARWLSASPEAKNRCEKA